MEQFDITAFREGDLDAFNQIYRFYYRMLCFFALGIIKNQAEAEDIVSESMVKLWKKREGFDHPSGIRSFLYVTVRHGCIDYLKAKKRHDISHREVSYLSAESEELVDGEMMRAGILQEIYGEINALPPQCQLIFKLIFFENRTTAQVAEALSLKPQTVLNQKTRALQLLRTSLLKRDLSPTM